MELAHVDKLYRQLGPVIYRRCLKLLGDVEMAKDATQEVFVRTLRQAGNLHEDRAYLPWLYRVATNYCLDRMRERARRAFEPLGDELAPASTANQAEARQLVGKLLSGLDDRSQQIAVHFFLDRMTQEEIAEVMQLSRKSVGKRIKKIRDGAAQLGPEL